MIDVNDISSTCTTYIILLFSIIYLQNDKEWMSLNFKFVLLLFCAAGKNIRWTRTFYIWIERIYIYIYPPRLNYFIKLWKPKFYVNGKTLVLSIKYSDIKFSMWPKPLPIYEVVKKFSFNLPRATIVRL